jgi:outer membrane protein
MKHLFFPFLMLFVALQAQAQEKPTVTNNSFTLEQCLEYAYKNATTIRKAELEIQNADARVKDVRSIGLPQVNANVQFIDNYNIQTSFLPAKFFNPNAPEGSPPVGVKFGTTYLGNATLQVSQILFSGSYIVGLQAANTYKQLAAKSLDASKVGITENVTKAYLLLIVNKERIKLLDNNISRVDSFFSDTKKLLKQGFVEQLDIDRLEVSLNNIKSEKTKIEGIIKLSNEILKFQMGMPADNTLDIQGDISTYQLTTNDTEEKVDYTNRIEYKLLDVNTKLLTLDLKNKRWGYMPTLSAFLQTGMNTGVNGFQQWGDFKNNWFSFGLFGFRLDVPIFDGLQKKYKIQQSKIELLKVQEDKKSLELAINFQTNQAKITLQNAQASLEIQKRNQTLAAEVLRVTKIKFKQGVGSNIEITNAEAAAKDAETNYYNALYDALIAKVDLDKALGKLGQK